MRNIILQGGGGGGGQRFSESRSSTRAVQI